MIRVVVTGASGFVGRAVCDVLSARGAQVVRVSRAIGDSVDVACDLGDARSSEGLRLAFEGATAVVHAAAHVHRPDESAEEISRFRAVNVGGTERVVRAAASAGVTRIVYVSTIGVHGFRRGSSTEDDVPEPESAYASTKLLGESIVTAGAADARIVRLATVYGAGDMANFARLGAAIARGRFVIPGDGSTRKSVIAIDDAAELIADVTLRDAVVPTMHLASPRPVSIAEVCDGFARAFGVRPPRRVPLGLLRMVGSVGDVLRAAHLPAPLDSATLTKLTRDTVVDTRRLSSFAPDHRFRELSDVLRTGYEGVRR